MARNVIGYSALSPSISIIAATVPPQMSSPTVTLITPSGSASSIDIAWTTPSATGGSAITGYYV